ncbi:antibiotic biosynthesis monooxygenase [Paenibacillus sp. 1011MAR3C5]|uniref:antibiotic biosynthesis monooxygenase n=1 Tax=Paenibacillus sp. 1011MAR3C5 TaxID=1675787 RepID=UPI000E6B6DF3|nr:antibiotic biosynthesis monooxygenase [Paenibacillus sp. 1011MAR3C5]RJE90121.1 antibiotic biosynthesis monooxygenase [Paenibacillus sp. 1011MAR3C5]
MFIQLRTIVVETGHAEQVAERFGSTGAIDEMPGLIDRTVMVSRKNKESEEVIAMIRWESEEAWKNWEKSPAHIAGHREKRNDAPPSYILSTTVKMYDVKKVIAGSAAGV